MSEKCIRTWHLEKNNTIMFFLRFLSLWLLITYFNSAHAQSTFRLLSDSSNKVLVAAHRGDHINYPENSIPAIQSCINMGIDIVEIDIQRTRDGHFILMHDATVNRTTNGRGKVSNYFLKDILKLKLKNADKSLSSFHVPTLDTILQLCKSSIIINIDKSSGQFELLERLISKYSKTHHIILKSMGSATFFKSLSERDTLGITYMPILKSNMLNPDSFIIQSQAQLVEVFVKNDSDIFFKPHVLQTLKTQNCNVWLNVLFESIAAGHKEYNSPEAAWEWAISKQAKVIQTDYPLQLLYYLISHNLHKHSGQELDSANYNAFIKQALIRSSFKTLKNRTNTKKNKSITLQYHYVKTGETLSGIAIRYNVSLKSIRNYNKRLSKGKYLKPGTRLRIN